MVTPSSDSFLSSVLTSTIDDHVEKETKSTNSIHAEFVSRLLKYPLPFKYISMDTVKPTLIYFSITSLLLTGEVDTYLTPTDQQKLLDALVYHGEHEYHIANQYALLATYVQLGYHRNTLNNNNTKNTNQESIPDFANIPSIPTRWKQQLYTLIPLLYRSSGNIGCYPTTTTFRSTTTVNTTSTNSSNSSHHPFTYYPYTEIEADVRFIYSMLMCYIFADLSNFIPSDLDGSDVSSSSSYSSLSLPIPSIRQYIIQCQTYEGGFSLHPGNESHGGSTYCAVMSLILLAYIEKYPNRPLLPLLLFSSPSSADTKVSFDAFNIINLANLRRWLHLRLPMVEYDYTLIEENLSKDTVEFCRTLPSVLPLMGITGRTNKDYDSCYSYWILGTLVTVDHYARDTEYDKTITSSDSSNRGRMEKNSLSTDTTTNDPEQNPSQVFVSIMQQFLNQCAYSHDNSTNASVPVDGSQSSKTSNHPPIPCTINGGYSRVPYGSPDIFHTHYSLWGQRLVECIVDDELFSSSLSSPASIYPLLGIKL